MSISSGNRDSISHEKTKQQKQISTFEDIGHSAGKCFQQLVDNNKVNTYEDVVKIFDSGRRMLQDGDFSNAIKYIRYAAQHGIDEASFLLGYCYDHGIGLSRNSSVAAAYYRQGAISNKNYKQYIDKYRGLNKDGLKKAAEEGKKIFKRKGN